MSYFTFGDAELADALQAVHEAAQKSGATTGRVYTLLVGMCEEIVENDWDVGNIALLGVLAEKIDAADHDPGRPAASASGRMDSGPDAAACPSPTL